MLRGEIILCLAAASWTGMWARAQHFMSILARQENQVIYVNPPITYLSSLKNPALRGKIHNCYRQVEKNIYVYTPPVILPFGNIFRKVNVINQRIIAAGLKKVYRKIGLTPTFCWTYLPNSVDMLLPRGITFIYDCADEHTAFPGLIRKKTVQQMENELFARADTSLVSAQELYRRKQGYASNLAVVPNGADVAHFSSALKPELDIPDDVSALSHPVVGYVGAVSAWFDQEMVVAAARAHKKWSIVLVGPVDTNISSLTSMPNVHVLGRRDYSRLPAYLKFFDATVIPFKINALTRGVNPVKLYEYLSAGKPVVSSNLPEVEPFMPVVAVAGNADEFVKKLEEELAEDSKEKVTMRLRLADQNSWAARLAAAEEAIESYREL